MPTDKSFAAIASALSEADGHRRRADVIEANYYKELARLALAACPDPTAAFFPAQDGASATSALLDEAGGICQPGASGALFAGYCVSILEKRGALPPLSAMLPPVWEDEVTKVAYVTGSAADDTFSAFADEFASLYPRRMRLRPRHAEHIAAACDCVLDGEADLAIIPVWNNRDGRLRSFYRMISGYELKILSVAETSAEDNRTVYALCGTELCALYRAPAVMEFSVRGQAGLIRTVTDAVAAQGHTISEVSSYPTPKAENVFHFILKAGGDLRQTVLYLSLFHPDSTVFGIYGNRESNA